MSSPSPLAAVVSNASPELSQPRAYIPDVRQLANKILDGWLTEQPKSLQLALDDYPWVHPAQASVHIEKKHGQLYWHLQQGPHKSICVSLQLLADVACSRQSGTAVFAPSALEAAFIRSTLASSRGLPDCQDQADTHLQQSLHQWQLGHGQAAASQGWTLVRDRFGRPAIAVSQAGSPVATALQQVLTNRAPHCERAWEILDQHNPDIWLQAWSLPMESHEHEN